MLLSASTPRLQQNYSSDMGDTGIFDSCVPRCLFNGSHLAKGMTNSDQSRGGSGRCPPHPLWTVDGVFSQKSTVVRRAPVTPFSCFLILPVKQHKK